MHTSGNPSAEDLTIAGHYLAEAAEAAAIFVEPSRHGRGQWDAYIDRTSIDTDAFLDSMSEDILLLLRDGHPRLAAAGRPVLLRSTGRRWQPTA
jgi:hypothetical protein